MKNKQWCCENCGNDNIKCKKCLRIKRVTLLKDWYLPLRPSTQPKKHKMLKAKFWMDSCDNCNSQEDGHYCLLHTKQIKNMNKVRCMDWKCRFNQKKEKV